MSDLLAPILVVMENEVDAFWCFSGFIHMMVSLSACLSVKVCIPLSVCLSVCVIIFNIKDICKVQVCNRTMSQMH